MSEASTNPNPKVTNIRLSVQQSCAELVQIMEGPLAKLDPLQLYTVPTKDEWTIMQNLAHILEFMPYWGNQIAQLVAAPGSNFGRVAQDEKRLRFIAEHERDTLSQVLAAFPASYAQLEEVLGRLTDSDLAITGRHVKYGERPLEWFIHEFVTQHLQDHVVQLKAEMEAVR